MRYPREFRYYRSGGTQIRMAYMTPDVNCWKNLSILAFASKGVAKIVQCGLPQDSLKPLCLVLPHYCARKIWKKLSISVGGLKKKLRRLSTVGSHDLKNAAGTTPAA